MERSLEIIRITDVMEDYAADYDGRERLLVGCRQGRRRYRDAALLGFEARRKRVVAAEVDIVKG
jgi:hypothetical protein